jgi:hypothetical protein
VLTLVARNIQTLDWPMVWHEFQRLSYGHLTAAAGLALLSYGLYASFDLIGRRLTAHHLSVTRTLGTAAISYAFNLNVGAWIGSIAMRLRLYSRWGLSTSTVMQIVAYSIVTNWLGFLWVGGVVLVWAPPPLPESWMLPDTGLRVIGIAMVMAAMSYLLLCRTSCRRELTLRGHTMTLPSARLGALQAAAGGANWLLIGTIVWALLGGRIDYPSVLGVMLLAAVVGIVTHVPGNLGVLESVVIVSLGARLPIPELLAAVLAYRVTYCLLPLALALPAYGLGEAAARRTASVPKK